MKALVPILAFLVSCSGQDPVAIAGFEGQHATQVALTKFNDHSWLIPFERTAAKDRISEKIETGKPLVVHCLVPLCDNSNQGIVPTTASLGDGFSTRTNLYWATRHGMKRYFELSSCWKTLAVCFEPSDTILERVAFERDFSNGARVILVCDAYRGDQMKSCLEDYFNYLAGKKTDSLFYSGMKIRIGERADLIVFNGHNGLMDVQPEPVFASCRRQKDAVVIACSSHWNYTEHITYANCYPLVTTTSSLYPGATVLDRIIGQWALNSDPEKIRFAAVQAYDEMKDCGIPGADAMFYSGW